MEMIFNNVTCQLSIDDLKKIEDTVNLLDAILSEFAEREVKSSNGISYVGGFSLDSVDVARCNLHSIAIQGFSTYSIDNMDE